jgi:hypothetical protein
MTFKITRRACHLVSLLVFLLVPILSYAQEVSMSNPFIKKILDDEVKSSLLTIKVTCGGADHCVFEGQHDIFIDINIINNQETVIGFPLEFIKSKGPSVRIFNHRSKETGPFLRTPPPHYDLIEKFTPIPAGKSVSFKWVIHDTDIKQFGESSVDVSAELTIMATIEVNGKKVDFKGSDVVRIVGKDK